MDSMDSTWNPDGIRLKYVKFNNKKTDLLTVSTTNV
jgi:hypothetical protein